MPERKINVGFIECEFLRNSGRMMEKNLFLPKSVIMGNTFFLVRLQKLPITTPKKNLFWVLIQSN